MSEWIPIEPGCPLPEPGVRALVVEAIPGAQPRVVVGMCPGPCQYWFEPRTHSTIWWATHWMPLPEPPPAKDGRR